MERLRLLIASALTACMIAFAAHSAPAVAGSLTPDDAVAAYIDGLVRHDFDAVLAATATDELSKKFDFVAFVDRLGALVSTAQAPSSDPMLVAINRAILAQQFARQVQVLIYRLMSDIDVVNGRTVVMSGDEAAVFAAKIDPKRLAAIKLLKVGSPNPAVLNGERYRASTARIAKAYGADDYTERLALISFEGTTYVVGFTLLLYSSNWVVQSQNSAIAGGEANGLPKPITPAEFEAATQ